MDEFEIFRARASGCEISVEDLQPNEVYLHRSPRGSLRSEAGSGENHRRSYDGSSRRKSIKKDIARRLNEGSLQVKVEIQPPSPVACRRQCDEVHDHDRQSLTSNEEKYVANGNVFYYGDSSHVGQQVVDTVVRRKCSSSNIDSRRSSRYSLTTGSRRSSMLPPDEFELNEDTFRRSKSCKHTGSIQTRNKQLAPVHGASPDALSSEVLNEETSHRQVENTCEECGDLDDDAMELPTIYRVRSFTTKKGEIVSRGDSFKICGTGSNRNLLFVGDPRPPGQRRCSAAVTGGSSSRLEVCSLAPGTNSLRRSSFTCLAANQLDVTSAMRRGSSEHRRVSSSRIDVPIEKLRKMSMSSVRESLPLNSVNPADPAPGGDHWSNKSSEGTIVEVPCFVEEEAECHPPQVYHVTVLGYPGVGKTTLINQLMTSEYLANKEQNEQGEDDMEMVVSVVLDDIESTVHFQEGPHRVNMSSQEEEEEEDEEQTDAYLLVFSVTERNSFSFIQTCLYDILKHDKRLHSVNQQHKAPLKLRFQRNKSPNSQRHAASSDPDVAEEKPRPQPILPRGEGAPIKPVLYMVANKQDLVRNRVVSESEVKRLVEVKRNRCKYVEVSALLNHKVDDVLVDIVREIRRRAAGGDNEDSDVEDTSGRGCLQQAVVGFCGKLFK